MRDFIFYNPTKIIFGKNATKQIKENIVPYGKKVLLTYGKGNIKKHGIYQKVITELKGLQVKEFSGIEPNPRVETIRKAVKLYKQFSPDIILAVGGGSVIDGSKLLASSLYYDGDPWDFLVKPQTEPKKYVPLAVILTVAATGSEMNCGAVITRWKTNEKTFFGRPQLYPKFSILDPQNTYSLSLEQTAYGIVDIFSHVLEQYLHTVLDVSLQDSFSEGILHTVLENSAKVLVNPQDYSARANIMLAAAMALNGLIVAGAGEDWATHNIEHEISAFYDIPHGAGLAIITPRWMEVVKQQKKAKLVQYGKRIWGLKGKDSTILNAAIKKTYDYFKSLKIKMSFNKWHIGTEYFPIITERLAKRKIGEVALTKNQIKQILNQCLT